MEPFTIIFCLVFIKRKVPHTELFVRHRIKML